MINKRIVLISGSRGASAELLEQVRIAVLRVWWKHDEISVGDAPGVDAEVVKTAQHLNMPYMAYGIQREARNGARRYTNIRTRINRTYAAYTTALYRRRDEFMVQHANVVLCFWDGLSLGTKYVYEYACKMGKDAYLIGDDGMIENNGSLEIAVPQRRTIQVENYQQVL